MPRRFRFYAGLGTMVITDEMNARLESWSDPEMLPLEQARGLYAVLHSELPDRGNLVFLEFGTFRAASTSILALFAKERGGRVISVDTFDGRGTGLEVDTFADARENLRERGLLDVVQLVRSRTQFFDYTQVSDQPVDVFFHDASHEVHDVLFDFANVARYLADDCLVLIHDVAKGGGPTRPALEYLCRLYGVKGKIFLDANLGAFRLNGNPLRGRK